MIEWLTKLPRLIDAFIAGVIEFFYRFFSGVVLVLRRPLAGARALEREEEELSSRTMLFGSATVLVVVGVIGVAASTALTGTGLIHFFLFAVLIYVIADAGAAVTARLVCARGCQEPPDKARDFLRYGFAAALVLVTVDLLLLDLLVDSIGPEGVAGFDRFGPGKKAGLGLAAIVLQAGMPLAFYPPAAVMLGLWRADGARGGCLGLGVGLAVTGLLALTVGGALAALIWGYPSIRQALDGPISIDSVTCTASRAGVRVVAVAENRATSAFVVAPGRFLVRLDDGGAHRWTETVPVTRVDDEVALVEPRATFLIKGEAIPASPAFAAVLAAGRPGTCTLIGGGTGRKVQPETGPLTIAAAKGAAFPTAPAPPSPR